MLIVFIGNVLVYIIVCDGFDNVVFGICIFESDCVFCGVVEFVEGDATNDIFFIEAGDGAFSGSGEFAEFGVLDPEKIGRRKSSDGGDN